MKTQFSFRPVITATLIAAALLVSGCSKDKTPIVVTQQPAPTEEQPQKREATAEPTLQNYDIKLFQAQDLKQIRFRTANYYIFQNGTMQVGQSFIDPANSTENSLNFIAHQIIGLTETPSLARFNLIKRTENEEIAKGPAPLGCEPDQFDCLEKAVERRLRREAVKITRSLRDYFEEPRFNADFRRNLQQRMRRNINRAENRIDLAKPFCILAIQPAMSARDFRKNNSGTIGLNIYKIENDLELKVNHSSFTSSNTGQTNQPARFDVSYNLSTEWMSHAAALRCYAVGAGSFTIDKLVKTIGSSHAQFSIRSASDGLTAEDRDLLQRNLSEALK